jgi:hypothetical protein
MPTTYKTLGQTSATAASASVVSNLVPDAVVNIAGMSQSNLAANNTVQLTTTGYTTAWRGQSESGTNQYYSGIDLWTGGTTANISWQGTNSLWVNNNSASTAQQGFTTSAATTNTAIAFNGSGTLHTAALTTNGVIPVVASTTYYYGGYVNVGSTTTSTSVTYIVKWYTSTGGYISGSNATVPTLVANTWLKASGSATSPSTAAYATVTIFANQPANRNFGIDGIWFSTLASSTTTFPTPTTTALANTATNTPFDTRLTNAWSGTDNLSTTVNSYAGALTDLYTVPSTTQTVVSSIAVANLGLSATTYRILVLPSGQTAAKKNFIAFDEAIAANSSVTRTIGITLAAGDKIQIASDVSNVSASLFGSEIA